ncbi:MAG: hypothetical protein RLZZ142_1132 [Verrucomicrobiota bacterium]
MGLGDEHAFAEGESVGLHHNGEGHGLNEGGGLGAVGEAGGTGGGDAVPEHEILGKYLGGFELGGGLRGTENAESRSLELIHDSGGESVVRADDGEVDLFLQGEGDERRDILDFEGNALGDLLDAGVARGTEEGGNLGRLAEFPCEGVFSATAAEDEDFHKRRKGALGLEGDRLGLEWGGEGAAFLLDQGLEGGIQGLHAGVEQGVVREEPFSKHAIGWGGLGRAEAGGDLREGKAASFEFTEADASGELAGGLLGGVRVVLRRGFLAARGDADFGLCGGEWGEERGFGEERSGVWEGKQRLGGEGGRFVGGEGERGRVLSGSLGESGEEEAAEERDRGEENPGEFHGSTGRREATAKKAFEKDALIRLAAGWHARFPIPSDP